MRQYSLEVLLPAYQTQEIRDLTLSSDFGINTSGGGVKGMWLSEFKTKSPSPA